MARRAAGQPDEPSTRDRIVAKAAEHLAVVGPRGLELRAVCLDLGVSPSLVNYHFSSPGEVVWRAALYGYEAHILEQKQAFDRAEDGRQALEQWVLNTIEWKRTQTGLAAVIDYPMLALGAEDEGGADEFVKALSGASRANVTTLGCAVYSVMTGRAPKRLSTARVAALIKLNREFAYWISLVGFGGQGAAMWVAGRKPYGFLWKAFGFDPDSQIRATLNEVVVRMQASGGAGLPDDVDDDASEIPA